MSGHQAGGDVEALIDGLRSRHRVESGIDDVLSAKLRRRGRSTHATLGLDEVGRRLDAFLAARLDAPCAVSDLARLPGGASKEQFSFTLDWAGAEGRRQDRMVLRMNAPASIVQTGRRRELELLQAVAGTVPVPPAFFVTEDPADFGEPALICGFVPGVAAPTRNTAKASGIGTAYDPDLRARLAAEFVECLARLHTLDWRCRDLPSFDVPAEGTTDAVDWRLGLWDRVWEEDSFEPHPTVTLTRQWLWDNRPPVDHVSIVHGDYRNGNFLFDEDTGEITAVLDWELGHLGDRHHDLAYAMLNGWGHVDDDGRYLCSGLLPADDLVKEYERLSGLPVDPARLEYYTVLNMYWATVALSATAVRIAHEGMTHLDAMMTFLSGLGVFFMGELNEILERS